MATPTISEMLKYANLQMAAEALYGFDTKEISPALLIPGNHYSGAIADNWLTTGNEHASRFAPTEAEKFKDQWKVVDHISNTTTGFSGTLFQALKDDPAQGIKAGEYVLSFRSTEFIDDAVRDCLTNNGMEVSAGGWALGQITDMEAWYKSLVKEGGLQAGKHYSVTGYSLGGHLATAFKQLHPNDAAATYNPSKIALQFTDTRVGLLPARASNEQFWRKAA